MDGVRPEESASCGRRWWKWLTTFDVKAFALHMKWLINIAYPISASLVLGFLQDFTAFTLLGNKVSSDAVAGATSGCAPLSPAGLALLPGTGLARSVFCPACLLRPWRR